MHNFILPGRPQTFEHSFVEHYLNSVRYHDSEAMATSPLVFGVARRAGMRGTARLSQRLAIPSRSNTKEKSPSPTSPCASPSAPAICTRLHLQRPKSHFNRKGELKPSAPAKHCVLKTPDIDNIVKFVLDSLEPVHSFFSGTSYIIYDALDVLVR